MKSITVSKELSLVDGTILSRLKHLDLSGHVTHISNEAKGHGGFAEVFRGRCIVLERGELEIAVKRLRFHVNSTDCKQVSAAEARLGP